MGTGTRKGSGVDQESVEFESRRDPPRKNIFAAWEELGPGRGRGSGKSSSGAGQERLPELMNKTKTGC